MATKARIHSGLSVPPVQAVLAITAMVATAAVGPSHGSVCVVPVPTTHGDDAQQRDRHRRDDLDT